jgi:hypothetical protein
VELLHQDIAKLLQSVHAFALVIQNSVDYTKETATKEVIHLKKIMSLLALMKQMKREIVRQSET